MLVHTIVSEGNHHPQVNIQAEEQISTLLSDSILRYLLIQKLTNGSHGAKQSRPTKKNDGAPPGGYPFCSCCTPFGSGGWPPYPIQFPFVPFPTTQSWGPFHTPPVATGTIRSNQSLHGSALGSDQPGSSRGQGQEELEEDYVDLLEEHEASELVQFEPAVDDEGL